MTCIKVVGPGRTVTILCSEIEKRTPDPGCPNAEQHTPHPVGYGAHSNWAEQMLETHQQKRCDGCGLLNIWVPREQATTADGSNSSAVDRG